jgi:aminoglycoside phosphotransferase (APT) family kinase protein
VDPTPAAAYRARLADIAAMSPPSPVVALGRRWLARHEPPPPDRVAIVHADLRNGNLIVDIVPSSHAYGLAAAIDWELGHVGDPMEDLAWLCLNAWRFGHIDLPVGGFGHRADLYAGYVDGGGTVNAERVHHWEVLGALKWGLICEGRADAFLSGAERDVEHAAVGRRASETEIDLLELLAAR